MKHTLIALGIAVAYTQNYPCIVGGGLCVETSTPTATSETLHPIAHATFTATAVLTDSCTICGKEPTP